MAFNWDFVVGTVVLIFFILIVWARISKQTIAEVIGDIKEMLSGGVEEIEEQSEEVVMYE